MANVCSISLKQIKANANYQQIFNGIINASNKPKNLHQYMMQAMETLDTNTLHDIMTRAGETLSQDNRSSEAAIISQALGDFNIITQVTKTPAVTDSKALLDYTRPDSFFPVLQNTEINKNEIIQMQNQAFGLCYYSPEDGLIDPSKIDIKTVGFKNRLYKIIRTTLGSQAQGPIKMVDTDGQLFDIISYQNNMQLIWAQIQKDAYNMQNAFSTSPDVQQKLRVMEAFYILNNFDSWIKWASGNTITVDSKLDGSPTSTKGKYRQSRQKKALSSFEGSHTDLDAQKQESKIFKRFWATIPKSETEYCTAEDLRKLCSGIQEVLNSDRNDFDFLITPNLDSESVVQNLIGTKSLLQKLVKDETLVDNFLQALKTFSEHYKTALNNCTSIKEKQELAHSLNFVEQFLQEVQIHCNKTYIGVDETGNPIIKSQVGLRKSKMPITSSIERKLRDNIEHHNFAVYRPRFEFNSAGTYTYSNRFKEMFFDMLGINLSQDVLQIFSTDEEAATKLWAFLDDFRGLVDSVLLPKLQSMDKETAIADFMRKLKNTGSFIAFSDVLVNQNKNNVIKLLDQGGNPQPVSGTPNTLQNVKANHERFIKLHGSTDNILAKFSSLYAKTEGGDSYKDKYREHIAYRQDLKNGDKVYKAAKLPPLASAQISFNSEFLSSILEENSFFTQLDCYSDKVTIALAAINVLAQEQWIGSESETKRFVDLTSTELQTLWYQQKRDYYQKLKEDLIEDWTKLFNQLEIAVPASSSSNIFVSDYSQARFDQFVDTLETLNAVDLIKAARDYNSANPNDQIELTDQIHYCENKAKNDLNNNGKCRFNKTLYFNILGIDGDAPSSQLLQYYQEGQNESLEALKNINRPYWESSYVQEKADFLCALFELENNAENVKRLQDFFSQTNTRWNTENSAEADLVNAITSKYFWMSTLVSEAELQMTTKENYVHEGKKTQKPLSSYRETDGSLGDTFYQAVVAEQSERRIKNTKRNNALVSSYIAMRTDNPYGVAKTCRVAMVTSNKQDLMNMSGDTHSQDVVDGSIYTLGIASAWEANSYAGKHIENTKKVIGFVPTKWGMCQIKCADYTLDNVRIANSFHEQDAQRTNNYTENAYERAKKMMLSGTFSEEFYQAYAENNKLKNGTQVRRYIGKTLYSLTGIKRINGHRLEFTWVAESSTEQPHVEQLDINNVYDLWEALGSYHTVEQRDGDWVTSNASMEYIANAISEYDPGIKQKITSKLVDISSCKSSFININYKEDVDNPNSGFLNTFELDNTCWGEQQDYSHESDESEIPFVTQVGSAISFNGKNIDLVTDAYTTMAALTMRGVENAGITYKGTQRQQFDFYRKITKELLNSLQSNSSRSDAITLTRQAVEAMQRMAENKVVDFSNLQYADANLPYSSPDIFYKLAANFITNMNHKSIKQRFPGIAIVQNPSQGQICVYEDNQGNVWTRNDILKAAREKLDDSVLADIDGSGRKTPKTDSEIIQAFFNSAEFGHLFTSQIINIDNGANDFELEDSYEITYNNGHTYQGIIQHPRDLIALHKEILDSISTGAITQVRKKFGQPRNLKVPNIRFTETFTDTTGTPHYRQKSLWLAPSTIARLETRHLANDKTANPNVRAEARVKEKRYLEWYRADLNGLGSKENPYYYQTLTDFQTDRKTYVAKAEYIPGEQIIPKVNKSAHSLGVKSLREIEQLGSKYFEGIIESEYGKRSAALKAATRDAVGQTIDGKTETRTSLSLVRSNDEIVYTFIKPSGGTEITTPRIAAVEENGTTVYYYQNENYENMFAIPSESNTKIYTEEINGKTIYYVVNTVQDPEAVKTAINHTDDINVIYRDFDAEGKYKGICNKYNTDFNPESQSFEKQKVVLAKELYNSFKLSNYTISVRIPSQSFQSFMGNKTVAFTEGDQNDGYINIYEIWFTGGDYDIDKSYTLMYALDKRGVLATTSPLSKLTNLDTLNASMRLPLPDADHAISTGDTSSNLIDTLVKAMGVSTNDVVTQLKDYNNPDGQVAALKALQKALETLNKIDNPSVTEAEFAANQDFINLLNKHQNYKVSEAGLKNRIANILRECAYDPKNYEESSVPMDSAEWGNYIEELEEENGNASKVVYNQTSRMTTFKLQYENSVGKGNVGIAANGNKAASALQQYYNESYKAWTPDSAGKYNTATLSDNARMNFKLTFHGIQKDRTRKPTEIYSETINHIGDVVFDEDAAKDLQKYITINWNDKDDWRDNSLFRNIQAFSQNPDSTGWATRDYAVSFVDNENNYKKEYTDLRAILKAYQEAYGIKETDIIANQESFLRFKYFARKFNPNVADALSVMISLATDNAKELKLAKINATPDLMSMHIALLTLGVPPKTVVDIGMNLLYPVAKMLETNPAEDNGYHDVKGAIENCGEFDTVTKESLLKVYEIAQQLRMITSFFKVNQGVTGQYVELLGFCNNLAQSYNRLAGNKNQAGMNLSKLFGLEGADAEIGAYQKQILSDFNKLRERRADGYSISERVGVNPMEIILNNPNFRAMIESMLTTFDTTKHVAAVARFIQDRSSADAQTQYDVAKYRKLIGLYNDFIIGKVLQSDALSAVRFNTKDLKTSLGLQNDIELPMGLTLSWGLDSTVGINNFMTIMSDYVIPQLQEKYKGNFFFDSLNLQHQYSNNQNVWQLVFDVFSDEDINEQRNIEAALADLKKVASYSSGLVTTSGTSITIGNALYLYNMIGTKHQLSSSSKVITTIAHQANSRYAKALHDMYIHYDRGIKDPNQVNDIDQEFASLELYQAAVLDPSRSITKTITSLDGRDVLRLDLQGAWINTLVLPRTYSTFDRMIEQARSKYGEESIIVEDPTITSSGNLKPGRVIVQLPGNNVPTYFTITPDARNIGQWKRLSDDTLKQIQVELNNAIESQKVDAAQIQIDYDDLIKEAAVPSDSQVLGCIEKLKGNVNTILKDTKSSNQSIIGVTQGYIKREYGQNKLYVANIATISEYHLLDLFLQSQFDRTPTLMEKYVILQDITNADPNADTIRDQYLRYMQEHFAGKEYLDAAEQGYDIFSKFVNQEELFYRDALTKEIQEASIGVPMIGDIVTFPDAADLRYIYIGQLNGQYLFIKTDVSAENSDGLLRRVDSTGNVQLLKRLRVDRSFTPQIINSRIDANNKVQHQNGSKIVLQSGDVLETNGAEYKVVTTFYTPTETNDIDVSYLVFGPENQLIEIQGTDVTATNKAVTAQNMYNTTQSIDFTEGKNSALFKSLPKRLDKGTQVQIKGSTIVYQSANGPKTFIGTDTTGTIHIYKYADIDAVNSESILVQDGQFNSDIQDVTMTFTNTDTLKNSAVIRNAHMQGFKCIFDKARLNRNVYPSKASPSTIAFYKFDPTKDVSETGDFNKHLFESLKRLDGYEIIKNTDLTAEGDIFATDNNKNFFKIRSKSGDVYEILYDDNKIVYTKDIKEFLRSNDSYIRHYSQNRDVIFANDFNRNQQVIQTQSEKSKAVTAKQKSGTILDYIKKNFGLNVVIQPDLPTAAMVLNDTIYVRDAKTLADEPIHEFSHLALASLRMRDPDSYYSLRNQFMTNVLPSIKLSGWNKILNTVNKEHGAGGHYESTTAYEEELMIKYLDLLRSSGYLAINTDEEIGIATEMHAYFNNAFNYLIGDNVPGLSDSIRQTEAIGKVIERYNKSFFEDVIQPMNILELRKNQKMRKIMDNIKEICN